MKVIVDTDPGIDDAVALGMLLTRKDVEILAITCVNGNVSVDQTTINALKILEAFDRKDVSVFKGADNPLLGNHKKCVFTNSQTVFIVNMNKTRRFLLHISLVYWTKISDPTLKCVIIRKINLLLEAAPKLFFKETCS